MKIIIDKLILDAIKNYYDLIQDNIEESIQTNLRINIVDVSIKINKIKNLLDFIIYLDFFII